MLLNNRHHIKLLFFQRIVTETGRINGVILKLQIHTIKIKADDYITNEKKTDLKKKNVAFPYYYASIECNFF